MIMNWRWRSRKQSRILTKRGYLIEEKWLDLHIKNIFFKIRIVSQANNELGYSSESSIIKKMVSQQLLKQISIWWNDICLEFLRVLEEVRVNQNLNKFIDTICKKNFHTYVSFLVQRIIISEFNSSLKSDLHLKTWLAKKKHSKKLLNLGTILAMFSDEIGFQY